MYSLFIVARILVGVLCLILIFIYSTLCPLYHLDADESLMLYSNSLLDIV